MTQSVEIDALLRDLRNPMVAVAESEAALYGLLAQAWDDGAWAERWDTASARRNPYRVTPTEGGRDA